MGPFQGHFFTKFSNLLGVDTDDLSLQMKEMKLRKVTMFNEKRNKMGIHIQIFFYAPAFAPLTD